MMEKSIYLEGVDPVWFWGVKNERFKKLQDTFPKLKIVTRGNELKIAGEPGEVERFEQTVDQLIEYFQRFNRIDESDVENIIHGNDAQEIQKREIPEDTLLFGESGKPIRARTVNQKKLVEESRKHDLVFAIGPAGTGKTYTAIALAVRALKYREVKRIILTRPAVEAGEKLGFLPGDYKEKLDPYLQPLYDALDDMIPSKKLKYLLEDKTIQIAPLAYMRGRTLDNAFVILDEAQNATESQLKMFLTRMGRTAKFILTGDITQIDLPDKKDSGLVYTLNLLKNVKGLSTVYFDDRDIIRHKLVKYIVAAYNKNPEKD